MSLVFGAAYYTLEGVQTDGSTATNFLDYVYFSLITQSTVGFGDYTPFGVSRFIVGLQIVLGTMTLPIFIGIIFAKIMLGPKVSIKIEDKIVFNPIEGRFEVRCFNALPVKIFNVKIHATLRTAKPNVQGQNTVTRNQISLSLPDIPVMNEHWPTIFGTKTISKTQKYHKLRGSIVLHPGMLNEDSKLQLTLIGSTNFGQVVTFKEFAFADVVCGHHMRMLIDPEQHWTGGLNMDHWGKYQFSDLENCTFCKSCPFNA